MTEIKHNLLTYATSQFDNPNAVIENINSQLIEQIGQKQIQHLKVILPYKNSSHDEKNCPAFLWNQRFLHCKHHRRTRPSNI